MFEHQVYDLEGDELTAENVYELYDEIGTQFGFDAWGWDSRDFVMIGHFYTDPMYIISYVVSNDAALQLYQMEQDEAGAGLAKYQQELDTEQTYFLAFIQDAGLESPFAPGRVKEVRQTLEEVLK
jgi:oligoendopeptidase F